MRTKWMMPMAALLVAGVALAGVQEATLEWKPRAGAEFKYKMTTEATVDSPMGSGPVKMSASMTNRIVEIRPDGSVVLESKQEDMKLSFMGMDMDDAIPAMTSKVIFNKHGEVLERSSDVPQEMDNQRLENVFVFVYPKTPVKPGDTWTHTTKGDTNKGTFDSEVVFTYRGIERQNNVEVHKVTYTFRELNAPKNMEGEGTAWLDVRDGELVKGTYSIKNVEFAEGIVASTMTAEVVRSN
jgi:hypothetical protein